ncbi:hypothetical protein U27_03430 [Candidatus Vecturithrix granuli]|uniref:Lipoprotein n=1 Tax=Vecturithrix granuli TaxID=1499967 RepID=A0A081BVW3_VECG1|nr:hypothetical protein U27_03430 [Candidatus Vecturithrix granuli]
MKQIFLNIFLICALAAGGCQQDSDYTLGVYDVMTTVQASTCPLYVSSVIAACIVPTSMILGQTTAQQWKLQRIAITDTGTEKVHLTITSVTDQNARLVLSGNVDHSSLCIEEQQNIQPPQETFYRFILIYGYLDQDRIVGQIHTFLSGPQTPSFLPIVIPSEAPCQISETFTGILSYSE